MKFKYIENRVAFILIINLITVMLSFLSLFAFKYYTSYHYLIFFIILFLLLIAELVLSYFWIYLPYKTNKHLLSIFTSGYGVNTFIDEINPLNKELEDAQRYLSELLKNDQIMNASKRQAQYLALQNQINPHFLYNTLEGIRSEALSAKLDSIASMTEALSTFFRYTISSVEKLVTLETELENTKNFFFIQQYRFGDRIKMSVIISEEDKPKAFQVRIPKLTLQPIVENAIFHGLERKLGEGIVKIYIEIGSDRLIITISDNGVGMDEQTLKRIKNAINDNEINTNKGGIALKNVNNRIKLLFGEYYGIEIHSTLELGTDVIINLPLDEYKN